MKIRKKRKIIVIDDDPTGSQTVHSCPILTEWDLKTLQKALLDRSPIMFILANSRSLSCEDAAATIQQICENLVVALECCDRNGHRFSTVWVSRSDSTLRGHFPLETDLIEKTAGPFDHLLLIPAFIQGGRVTIDGTHYMISDSGERVPVNETEFANDSVFGYKNAFLPAYVEEKTFGNTPRDAVQVLRLETIRDESFAIGNDKSSIVAVDSERQSDLDKVANAIWVATEASASRFLLRSGAGILSSLASLPPQPVPPESFHKYRRNTCPGVFLAGSHTEKTTRQLEALSILDCVHAIEVDVSRIKNHYSEILDSTNKSVRSAFYANKTPLIFTSREEQRFVSNNERLKFGQIISSFLVDVVSVLPEEISYLACKGGITSNYIISNALRLRDSRLLGQIISGHSVLQCPASHPQFPLLPIVICPGNVGGDDSLIEIFCNFGESLVSPTLNDSAARSQ